MSKKFLQSIMCALMNVSDQQSAVSKNFLRTYYAQMNQPKS